MLKGTLPDNMGPAYQEPVEPAGVREKLLELLGLEEVPQRADFVVDSVEEENGLVETRGALENSLGETVPAVLVMPKQSSMLEMPAVVCVPGTAGDAEQISGPSFIRPRPLTGPLLGWARELARRGFATMSITPKGTEIRRQSEGDWAREAKLLAPYGRTQMGVLVEETLLAARALAATEGVDACRIGLTGMSLGGNATWYAMACAPWIRAGVPVCGGLGRMERVIHESQWDRHSAYYFIPHMLRYFDHPEVVAACIAPRPFMMLAPTEDEDMPRSGVDDLIPLVSSAYEMMGHPGHFKVHQPSGNHVYLVEYFELVDNWFQRFLRT